MSIALISGTTIMGRQMALFQNAQIGYDRDHVVVVPAEGLDSDMLLARYTDLLNGRDEIEGITGMVNAFSQGWNRNSWDYKGEQKAVYVYRVESNFMDVMDIDILDGRSFDPARPADSTSSVIVNEAFAKSFGWDDPVGQVVEGFEGQPEVIGLVNDFNFLSLRNKVEPMIFWMTPRESPTHLLFQINKNKIAEAVELLRAAWVDQAPDVPFNYSFLDEDLASQYTSEQRLSSIVRYSSIIAILIACLGLFGLAALSVQRRKKEIGIRRVMGASTAGITALLSKDFLRVVAIAIVLSIPITWYFAEQWLENFAYRIDIGFVIFAIAAVLALSVALLTVSSQTFRAASANPVDTLRSE
jgi:putative ABC transport system permease protein